MIIIVGFTIENSRTQTYIAKLITKELSNKLGANVSLGKVDIDFFRRFSINDILLEDQQHDTLFYAKELKAKIKKFNYRKKSIKINYVVLKESCGNIQKDSLGKYNFDFLLTEKDTTNKPFNWKIECKDFNLEQANLTYKYYQEEDYYKTDFKNINLNIKGFKYEQGLLNLHLDSFSAKNKDYTNIKKLSTHFSFSTDSIMLSDLNLATNYSSINNSHIKIKLKDGASTLESIKKVNVKLKKSNINFKELALVVPTLKGMNSNVQVSGEITGNTRSLKGNDMVIRNGNKTFANVEFYLNDLTSENNMYLFIGVKRLTTTLNDISNIRLPYSAKDRTISFPPVFDKESQVTFDGNFSGFLNDFVVYGTFNSKQGMVKSDIAVVPIDDNTIRLKGKIGSKEFQIGSLVNSEELGDITFNANVNGIYSKKEKRAKGKINGEIEQVEWNKYNYKNIVINGELDKKNFSGDVAIDDSNLKFDFKGYANFNDSIPDFNFNLDLKKAMLGKLNLSKDFPQSEIGFLMNANFVGNNIDNLIGTIKIESGTYSNKNGKIPLENMQLESLPGAQNDRLNFYSKFFDVNLTGNLHTKSILLELKKIVNNYIPSFKLASQQQMALNKFDYRINIKDINTLTKVLAPKYSFEKPFFISGNINATKNKLTVKSSIPSFTINDIILRDISINTQPKDSAYTSKIHIGNLIYANNLNIKDIDFENTIQSNIINQKIVWGDKNISRFSFKTIFEERLHKKDPKIIINTEKSDIYIKDTLWHINPFSVLKDSSSFFINNFKFYNKSQQLNINGKISDNKDDKLLAHFSNFQTKEIDEYFNNRIRISGELNGYIKLSDAYNQRLISSDLQLNDFYFNNQEIGDIKINNQWDNSQKLIKSRATINNKEFNTLQANGWFNPQQKNYSYNADLNELPLVLLATVIENGINNFKGTIKGNIAIKGNANNITMDGFGAVKNGSLTVDFTKVDYYFEDTIILKDNSFLFKDITVKDALGNSGILNGEVSHNNFEDFKYQFSASSPKLLVMKTTSADQEVFNGTAIAKVDFSLIGKEEGISIDATGTSLKGTFINILPTGNSSIENYDFIKFVSPNDSVESVTFNTEDESKVSVNLKINATNEAKVQLIYNSQIGDMIKAQGDGFLTFKLDPIKGMSLYGNYKIEKGDYLFTLQNVINKRFSIENGSNISWSGDIADAIIDLKAIYKLRASVSDLLINKNQDAVQSTRIPVECKILLTENLSNPKINFDLNFPNAESRIVDELQQYFNSKEEINKQILSLMVLGKFYTPQYLRGDYESSLYNNVLGQTTSELFSNQLSNWLSQWNNNLQLGFNYHPGNQITDDEVQVALSTQLFNDRVIINGNVGNSVNKYTGKNTQLVGDFDIFVKLTPRGKLQLKAYNRYNNNLIYETAPYTQGVGLLYKEEYNTWQEFLYKIKKLFKRKNE